MKVLIPSYHRPEKQRALEYLISLGFTREDIFIAVQCREDFVSYSRLYSEHAQIVFREGANVADNRNTLLYLLKPGEFALMMDDDIEYIARYVKPDRNHRYGQAIPITRRSDFDKCIRTMLKIAYDYNARTFALTVVNNMQFLHSENERKPYTLNCRIAGDVMGIIRDDAVFDRRFASKEDHDYALQQIAAGLNVVKFSNYVAWSKKHQTGGCFEVHRDEEMQMAKLLVSKWPMWVKHAKTPGEIRIKV